MKKILSLTLVIIMLASLVCGCSFLPEEISIINVNFYVGEEIYDTKTVVLGQTVSQPTSPKKENQIFIGWYVDGLFTYEYDFSSKVISELDLYARFTLDAVTVTNMITNSAMKSLVQITNKCYDTVMGGFVEVGSSTSQGSGVIIDISGGYAYALTNSHVVYMDETYDHRTITVSDPWGNEYEAYVYKNPSSSSEAFDASYDLALVYFKYTSTVEPMLAEISLGLDPAADDYVVSLGYPLGQSNAITYGKVINYQKLNSAEGDETSSVQFEIIYHNALIDHGSSGGPLLDSSGRLVGLNFAGFEASHYGCAIPLSKITEFLSKYVYLN